MSPVEVSHRNILNLLKIIADALDAIGGFASLDVKYCAIVDQIRVDMQGAKDKYTIGVSPYIAAYNCGNEKEGLARAAYGDFIGCCDIVARINTCIRRIETIANSFVADDAARITAIIARRTAFVMEPELEHVKAPFCMCGGRYIICADSDERRCASCGSTSATFEQAVEDIRPNDMGDVKMKQGRHHPHVHCKSWIGRLQAWDGPTIPDSLVTQLHVCCRRDRVNKKKITCSMIRKYLKEIKLTDYNVYIPFIRKLLTGISPPQLTQCELEQLYSIFDRMATAMKRMRPDNNITYYPYIIYKILDSTLPPGNRKAQILECIHLQSNKTMRLVDKIYAPICQEIDELKAKPTNKHEYNLLL